MIFNISCYISKQRSSAQVIFTCALVCYLFAPHFVSAQTAHCHTDEIMSKHLNDIGQHHEIKQYKETIRQMATARSGGVVVELPVVFHIIHSGESIGQGSNMTEAKIMEQFNSLNNDFAFQNADHRNNIPSQFSASAADTEIQFCLAQVDETGQATSGIIRYEFPSISSISFMENSIKPLTQWDPDKYINIWIVRMPDPSILGYSYLPTPTFLGTVRDGIVISHLKVGNQNASTLGRTLVHEMGHYLGLLHPWGNDEADCSEDDQISDTPAVFAPYYGCPVFPQFTCGTSDMFMNYMDYVNDNCMFMFTAGQKNIMHGIINNQRSKLIANNDALCNNTVSTSNSTIHEKAVDIFPNPCTDQLFISLSFDYQVISYQVYDLSGVLLMENDLHSNPSLTIPTQNLQNGAYVVRIVTNKGETVSKRFVKLK